MGRGILVDAGPDVGAGRPVPATGSGITSLPLVLVSHLDADHVGGLAGALAGRDVGEVATGTLVARRRSVRRLRPPWSTGPAASG